jgi:RNA polymerase sigma factor (sigma-70 family)
VLAEEAQTSLSRRPVRAVKPAARLQTGSGSNTQATRDDAAGDAQRCADLQTGDPAAFAAVYRDYVQLVYGFCWRRCADPAAAEDAVSVVFLEVWRLHEDAHTVDASLRPWLLAIAHNVVRNQNRSLRRHRAALIRYHDAHPDTDDGFEARTVEELAAIEQAVTVKGAIGRLSGKLRDVAELCLTGELTPKDAAQILHLPESTVRSRLALVRRRLQPLLRTSERLDTPVGVGHLPGGRHSGASVPGSQESAP